jgi:hypothetical protein
MMVPSVAEADALVIVIATAAMNTAVKAKTSLRRIFTPPG